jgi:hypothetical protein
MNKKEEKMALKQNCWDIMNCGRAPGGAKVSELDVCPAAIDTSSDGINGGKNAGRICWAVAGTFCGGKVQGEFAEKKVTCMTCEVFKRVQQEEGPGQFKVLKPGQEYKLCE